MSSTSVPDTVKLQLWGQAAGRCQYVGCNKPLYRDQLTKAEFNISYIAHIVADSPEGPRGDILKSAQLAKEISNLMLLCDTHHRLIDKHDVAGHPVDRLIAMKKIHEERMARVTDILKAQDTHIILFGAKIGQSPIGLNFNDAAADLLPGWYPADDRAIELGLKNHGTEDHNQAYWDVEAANLRHNVERYVKDRIGSGEIHHLSVFALGPQPLLMLLGHLLGDITPAEVYARHRTPPSWQWPQQATTVEFKLQRPSEFSGTPALVFSLSGSVHPDRITDLLGNQVSIWSVTIDQPFNDFLKAREDVAKFKECVQKVLDEIKLKHGQNAVLHVFPAMPAALAVEFGRCIMPKADLKMQLYDQNWETKGFARAIQL